MPLESKVSVGKSCLQEGLFTDYLFDAHLLRPLKRCVGLRNEGRNADGDLFLHGPFAERPPGEVGDAFQVFFLFSRESQHEIELDGTPPRGKDLSRRSNQVFRAVALVDHIPQTLGARFGRQGEARLPDPFDLFDQPRSKRLNAQRRESDGDPFLMMVVHQPFQQFFYPRIIAGTEGEERYLSVTS